MVYVPFVVLHLDIDDLAILHHRLLHRIDKAAVGFDAETTVTGQNFVVKFLIRFDAVGLDQRFASFVVAFTLDALNFAQQFAKEFSKAFVVGDLNISFAVMRNLLDDGFTLTLLSLFVSPHGDQHAVAHVSLFDILPWLNACQLGHHTVEDIVQILSLCRIKRGYEPQFDQLRIPQIVEGKQVGTGLFEC